MQPIDAPAGRRGAAGSWAFASGAATRACAVQIAMTMVVHGLSTSEPDAARSWTPLLDGELLSRANAAIDAIAHDLRALDPGALGGSLAGGAAGIALFFAYLGSSRDDDAASAEAEAWLDAAVGAHFHDVSLYGGAAGVAWTAAHLCDAGEAARLCTPVDRALATVLATPPAGRHYDLISGLVGFGVYALAAPAAATRDPQLRTIVEQLDALGQPARGGTMWFTPPALLVPWHRERYPEGYANFGVAHGVPGVLALLARLVEAGIEVERAGRLLEQGMTWMLASRLLDADSRFPVCEGKAAAAAEPARLAWCYGDLGIAPVFLTAARATGRRDWHAEALSLGLLAAMRPVGSTGVVDGGLCHGAAGVAHIFARLHHALGDRALAEVARCWYQRLLDVRHAGTGVGGFLALGGLLDDRHWEASPGFLEGAAGIGLALLAATSHVSPDWDDVLMTRV